MARAPTGGRACGPPRPSSGDVNSGRQGPDAAALGVGGEGGDVCFRRRRVMRISLSHTWGQASGQLQRAWGVLDCGFSLQQPQCWAELLAQVSACSQRHGILPWSDLRDRIENPHAKLKTPCTPPPSLQKAFPGGFGTRSGERDKREEGRAEARQVTHRRHRAYAPDTDSLSRTKKQPSCPALASSSSATTRLMSRWYQLAAAILRSRGTPAALCPRPSPASGLSGGYWPWAGLQGGLGKVVWGNQPPGTRASWRLEVPVGDEQTPR